MKRTLFLILCIHIIVGCKNDKTISQQTTNKELDSLPIDTTTYQNTSLKKESTINSEQLLLLFSQKRKLVSEKLKNISKNEANELYESYFKSNELILEKLIQTEVSILDKFYNEDTETKNLIKRKEKELLTHGLEFNEMGEGLVEIKTKNEFYYNIFKNYVTDDYRDYLEIKKNEGNTSYSNDGGLVISFRELGDRIIVWEKFMEKYPNSKLIPSVKQNYKDYQWDYIFGMENTRTIEDTNPKNLFIYPENIEEFNRFKKMYPSSATNKLINIFFEHFKDDNIHDLIENEQRKL